MIYLQLAFEFFKIGLFSIGGGMATLPFLMDLTAKYNWYTASELANVVAISESTPGPVGVNMATYAGYNAAGIPGALISILGTSLPPLIILSVISFFYAAFRSNAVVSAVLKGMQAGVAAVIADVVWSLGGSVLRSKSFLSILIMAGAFAATYWGGVNVVWIILVCGALGAAQPLLSRLAGKLRRKDGARP